MATPPRTRAPSREGANLGLGCGNPIALASLRPGETVLDLGSGAGFDCFLAARAVGETGRVIGVDMTHEMLRKARANAAQGGYTQVEFRLGEIEHLPVADASVDVIISNCVINLSPEKAQVFRDAFRVLKPGGRLAVSDVVATAPFPAEVQQDLALRAGCVAGASLLDDLEGMLRRRRVCGHSDPAQGRESNVYPRVGPGHQHRRLSDIGHDRSRQALRRDAPVPTPS